MQDMNSSSTGNQLVAFFNDKEDAFAAISELKDAGFTSDQIGLAMSGARNISDTSAGKFNSTQSASSPTGSAHDERGMWEKIKDFFTGEDPNYEGESYAGEDYERTFGHLSLSDEQSRYYHSGISSGGALVTVNAPAGRLGAAREILEDNDADLRSGSFSELDRSHSGATATTNLQAGADAGRGLTDQGERHIQLRGEMLRAVKERVQKGEIRLRKHVITENQTLNVPVTREEVIVEQVPASGTASVSGAIGDQGEIRVPVSEERVRVTKEPVVTGEVRVQKRTVQDNQQVSGEVRHEEVDVENQGQVAVTDKTRKKKPAA
ncbi:MAG TPA: YsnF/AvaK domain-containing protein [Candidatus Limnocylindrales bacterium]|nr:YsnF/AvaK domain-containing protein [Candidatus Limnocylindrales bacterium]